MNIGYYKLAKYMGVKCHNDLSFFFTDRLDNGWTYKSAHAVADLYKRTKDGWTIEIDGETHDVIETDKRKRVPVSINGITDKLSAQIDQIVAIDGKKYLLDWKFTKRNEEVQIIVDDARQQIAYYAWILNDPDVVGGAYVIASLTSKDVLSVGKFEFEPQEPERELIRRLTQLPGYEAISYKDIARV